MAITVAELINKLGMYASQSPENGSAEVLMKQAGSDVCFRFTAANDARGVVPGTHFLIFQPDESNQGIGVKSITVQ